LNLVLIGPPGSGKGTQSARVALAWNVPHISTGDILRRAVASGSMLGEAVRDSMSRGELVSDEIMTDLVAARLADLDGSIGFVFDGFPRTVEQAYALDVLLEARPLAVVELSVADDELVRRLSRRRIVEGREDDDESVVRERLRVYHRDTQPVIDFYKARRTLLTVNGNLPPEEVTERITLAVDPVFDHYFDNVTGKLE
jgi:adenylate kinase